MLSNDNEGKNGFLKIENKEGTSLFHLTCEVLRSIEKESTWNTPGSCSFPCNYWWRSGLFLFSLLPFLILFFYSLLPLTDGSGYLLRSHGDPHWKTNNRLFTSLSGTYSPFHSEYYILVGALTKSDPSDYLIPVTLDIHPITASLSV